MKKLAKALAMAGIIAAGSNAQAIVVDFYYSGAAMATMSTTGSTDFSLQFLTAPSSSTAFINELFMAGPGGTFTDTSSATSITASYDATGFTNAGYTFNWKLDFPQPNNAARFIVGETATWSIVTTDPNAWDFNMLHINAFLDGQSIKLVGCERGSTGCGSNDVPEPASLALLGASLLGLAFTRRQQKATKG